MQSQRLTSAAPKYLPQLSPAGARQVLLTTKGAVKSVMSSTVDALSAMYLAPVCFHLPAQYIYHGWDPQWPSLAITTSLYPQASMGLHVCAHAHIISCGTLTHRHRDQMSIMQESGQKNLVVCFADDAPLYCTPH